MTDDKAIAPWVFTFVTHGLEQPFETTTEQYQNNSLV